MKVNFFDADEAIERRILDLIHRHGTRNVAEVVAELKWFDNSITDDEIHDIIRKLEQRDAIVLSESISRPSFPASLITSRAFVRFWIGIVISSSALCAAYLFPQVEPWSLARIIIANMFLFVIPGYSLTQLLFPRERLQAAERIALWIVLSLGIVALIGMMLIYTPIGLKLESVVTLVAAFNITLAFVCAFKESLFEGWHKALTGI